MSERAVPFVSCQNRNPIVKTSPRRHHILCALLSQMKKFQKHTDILLQEVAQTRFQSSTPPRSPTNDPAVIEFSLPPSPSNGPQPVPTESVQQVLPSHSVSFRRHRLRRVPQVEAIDSLPSTTVAPAVRLDVPNVERSREVLNQTPRCFNKRADPLLKTLHAHRQRTMRRAKATLRSAEKGYLSQSTLARRKLIQRHVREFGSLSVRPSS